MSSRPASPDQAWDGFQTLLAGFRAEASVSGILTDFDGTISEIVPRFSGARIIPEAHEVLSQLAETYPLYIVSGRPAADVASLVDVPGAVYIGVHGLEWMDRNAPSPTPDPRAAPYREALREAAGRLRDAREISEHRLLLEDKVWMLGIHWRPAVEAGGSPEELADIARGLAARAAKATALKLREGRMVVELMPPVEAHKGTVVEYFVRRDGLRRCLYCGDDRTDIDVFEKLARMEQEEGFSSLRVAIDSAEVPDGLLRLAHIILPGPAWVAPFLRPLVL